MINAESLPHFSPYALTNFRIETLKIDSTVLRGNRLNDATERFHPVLVPINSTGPRPCVLILGGFSGNAPFYFNSKFNEQNAVQVLDKAVSKGDAPEAVYVFVDALTSWGGSQFLNSNATGRYEDSIVQEIIPALKKHYSLSDAPEHFCVMGGSSGGYGALHLSSKFPEIFGVAAAIAPDSFFEASITADLYTALPLWEKYQSGLRALEELRSGKLMKNRNWHSLLNAFGMSACYSPKGTHGDFAFPLDSQGRKIPEVWNQWLEKDPLNFLPLRADNLRKLSALYLDVGTKDNFHLQYGARQISQILKDFNIAHDYVEFDGNHFDIGERRPEVWRWLSTLWRS